MAAGLSKSLSRMLFILPSFLRMISFLLINKKIHSALKEKLKVILCIGETYKEKKNNKTFSVLKRQITIALKNIKKMTN